MTFTVQVPVQVPTNQNMGLQNEKKTLKSIPVRYNTLSLTSHIKNKCLSANYRGGGGGETI